MYVVKRDMRVIWNIIFVFQDSCFFFFLKKVLLFPNTQGFKFFYVSSVLREKQTLFVSLSQWHWILIMCYLFLM